GLAEVLGRPRVRGRPSRSRRSRRGLARAGVHQGAPGLPRCRLHVAQRLRNVRAMTLTAPPGCHRAHWDYPSQTREERMSDPAYATGVLLKQASDGDQRAWDELVNRFTRLLWSVARAHRLDTPDGADAVQTTWLRLLEHLDRIEDPERLVSWLVTTMRRECLRTLRRTGQDLLHASGETFEPPGPAEAAEMGLILAERDAMLWAAFDPMPERCRMLLRLLMTSPPPQYEAVAAMLDMPIGSIGPTRRRCLHHLRQLLAQTETTPTSQAHRLTSDTE